MLSGEHRTSVPDRDTLRRAANETAPDVLPLSELSRYCDPSTGQDVFAEEFATLLSLGIGKPLLEKMRVLAERHGSTLEDELLCSRQIDTRTYYEALARHLNLPYLDTIPDNSILDRDEIDLQLRKPSAIRLYQAGAAPVLVIVPRAGRLSVLFRLMDADPQHRNRLMVTSPASLRAAIWKAGGPRRVHACVNNLADQFGSLSARTVMWGRQGFVLGLLVSALLAIGFLAAETGLASLHLAFSLLYLSSLLIRFWALAAGRQTGNPPLKGTGPYPLYSVLVPLYQESGIVGQLVDALKKIDWPRSRLDIKLICECDDRDTLAALNTLALDAPFEIIEVPALLPRTKPKALSYALPAVRGDYVVIYDAEDIPHPRQIREACAMFQALPDQIACLQSPLLIVNGARSWLACLFAVEYAGLFQRILPALASFNFPFPLGGTSNHFRFQALQAAGGWDPYNVTEDADLGIRLYRMGYRSRMLTLPTLEASAEQSAVWMGQRKRWFKGWMQTLLVHSRQPLALCRQAGLLPALAFYLTIGGGLVSALAHPLTLLLIVSFFMTTVSNPATQALMALDSANLLASYAVFLSLGRSGLTGTFSAWRTALLIPPYWMMMALAAWCALLELFTKPHHWQKTPHLPNHG